MAIANSDGLLAIPDLPSVWPELISGRARIVDSGATQAQHYVQLAISGAGAEPNKLSARQVSVFERVLLGEAPKVVAMELGYSISTVASDVGVCLRAMGLTGRSHGIPGLLVLALHALRGRARCPGVRIERLPGESQDFQVTSSRLELPLRDRLRPSELGVVALLIEGKSYAEIARLRQTSVRTTANQVGSVYRKLQVSGRIALLCSLVAKWGSEALPAPPGPGEAAGQTVH